LNLLFAWVTPPAKLAKLANLTIASMGKVVKLTQLLGRRLVG